MFLIADIQWWFFMSLTMVKSHVKIMITYILCILNTIFVISYCAVSSKSSPVLMGWS